MLLNVMERLIFHEWDAMLLTMLNKMRTGVDEIANFGGLHVRHTVADDDPLILFSRETAHDRSSCTCRNRCCKMSSQGCGHVISMRSPLEIAAVAIDMVVRNVERLQESDRRKSRCRRSSHRTRYRSSLQKASNSAKPVANARIRDRIVDNFVSSSEDGSRRNMSPTPSRMDVLATMYVIHNRLPAGRIEMLDNRDNVVVLGNRSVEIAKDDRVLAAMFGHSLIPHASIAASQRFMLPLAAASRRWNAGLTRHRSLGGKLVRQLPCPSDGRECRRQR